MQELSHLIGGRRIGGTPIDTTLAINPATEDPICTAPVAGAVDVDAAVTAAIHASQMWSARSIGERIESLLSATSDLDDHALELAALECEEMGRPVAVGEPAVRGAIRGFRKRVEYARTYFDEYAEKSTQAPGGRFTVIRGPVGVVALITPWNYGISIILSGLASSLVAGNTVVLKPSEKTPASAVRLVELLDLPPGVLNVVLGDGRTGGELAAHPGIDLVDFTGSEASGRAVGEVTGRRLTRCILELGGKDAAIVDADVDPVLTAREVAAGAFNNTGQICTSIERIFVHRSLAQEFIAELVEQARWIAASENRGASHFGPLVDSKQREKVHAHVVEAVSRGARILAGGEVPDGPGFFYPPTVVAEVTPDMRIAREETFGPVAPIQIVDSFEEALELVNGSDFGLASTVFSSSATHIRKARQIATGIVWVNKWQGGGAAPEFEPRKASGMGVAGLRGTLDSVTRPTTIFEADRPERTLVDQSSL